MMIKCQECGTEISDSALSCPKCGAKMALATKREDGNVRAFIFIGCMVTFAFFGWLIVDQYEKEARSTWTQNALKHYFEAEADAEKARRIGEGAAEVIRGQGCQDGCEQNSYEVAASGAKQEAPLSDEVLGDEYSVKESEGVWEVYKGDLGTGFKAIDRNECLKYVKSLRGL